MKFYDPEKAQEDGIVNIPMKTVPAVGKFAEAVQVDLEKAAKRAQEAEEAELINAGKLGVGVKWNPMPEGKKGLMTLPTDTKDRKTYPIATGVIDYFPNALAEVAHVSFIGNEQHNPGTPLHWDRSKSTDEADALMRHFVERGKMDRDGVRHSAKMAWRALALLQKELEASGQGKIQAGS